MQKGDKVFIKNIDQIGVIESVTNQEVKVKLDTGQIITTLPQLVVIIQEAQSLIKKIVALFRSLFKK
jgi:hypothetical protein